MATQYAVDVTLRFLLKEDAELFLKEVKTQRVVLDWEGSPVEVVAPDNGVSS